MNSFLEERDVQFFQNGEYSDSIRIVYEDLLMMGVSTRNIEKVIRVVLKEFAGIEAAKLPGTTFAKLMLLEARGLAQVHVACELAGDSSDDSLTNALSSNTLQSDGTSKHGRSFMTYDINTANGKSFVTGLRETGGGDAETQLEVLKEVLKDISEISKNF